MKLKKEADLTPAQFQLVNRLKKVRKLSWSELALRFNKEYGTQNTAQELQSLYFKYKDDFPEQEMNFEVLKTNASIRQTASKIRKENKTILDHLVAQSDILDSIKNAINESTKQKITVAPKPKKDKKKRNMTLELLFSDIHYGKKTETVDLAEIRRRVQKMARVTVDEINRESKNFNVERLVLSLAGDIIESSHFHGGESEKGCEFGSARQCFEAIRSIYEDVIVPIAKTGIQLDVLAITGNHDRLELSKTYVDPGEHNLTYIIYKTLEMMTKRDGLKNVTWDIPKGPYAHTTIYGSTLLIEHGDECKNTNRDTLNGMKNKRQAQINKIIDFYRIGHFHDTHIYSQGNLMVNGSVPGQDSYAEVKGFNSDALQILNYYVETSNRPTPFFRTFPIYLDKKKTK